MVGKGGIGGVAVMRRSLNATLIALHGLGSSINDNPLCAVAELGAICSGLMTLGSRGCRPVILKAFLMISGVKVSLKGVSIACKGDGSQSEHDNLINDLCSGHCDAGTWSVIHFLGMPN